MQESQLKWEKEFIDIAVKELLKESNTNFDSLIKNIENNNDLFKIVKSILILGNKIDYNIHNPNISLGIMYGIFKNNNGKLEINNRVYEQLIYNYISSKIQTTVDFKSSNDYVNYVNEEGDLNVEKMLIKFQDFMKHEYSENNKEQ